MESKQNHQDKGFLPNFCDVTTVFMLVLLVELLSLVLTLVRDQRADFWGQLAMISLFTQWLALVNAAVLCGLRKSLNSRPIATNAMTSFIIMMLVTLLFSLLVIYLGPQAGLYMHTDPAWTQYFLLRNLSISAVIYAVMLRYFYIQHQWLVNLEAQSHAQIQALKARIRPHFLFNSMNTIASLIHIDANKAEQAVEDLSDLFRASLQDKTSHTLADELNLTRSYLAIEGLRLGDRLQVDWQLDDVPMDMEVPALCLQPLAENAIYYGIEPLASGGRIKITAQIEDNRLCLSINNPLHTGSRMRNHKSNHMAQDNIRKRLALMYGDEACFQIQADAQSYGVTLRIPVTSKT
jgi:two-component system sensor histidine kinase AlgZ